MKAILSIALLAFIGTSELHGEITYDNWPTAAGEAVLSDKYSVTRSKLIIQPRTTDEARSLDNQGKVDRQLRSGPIAV